MQRDLLWQPLSSITLSTFGLAVAAALTEAEKQRLLLHTAIQSHELVDLDAIVGAVAINEEQQYVLMIYAEQCRRWQQLNPIDALQQQLDSVLAILQQATMVNAEVNAILALIHAMRTHTQNNDWLIAIRTMLSSMGDRIPTNAFAWADAVLQQKSWTIGQQIELRQLWGLIWIAYDEVSEALWEAQVAAVLWADAASAAEQITYAKLWELLIKCWLKQEDNLNATEAARMLVTFADFHKDSLFTQPDGPRIWLAAAYYRALVAEFALDYSTAALWYTEAQKRIDAEALATAHPMSWLLGAGMARVQLQLGQNAIDCTIR